MAYKRLVATLVIKDEKLVKSYGYQFWRPAGTIYTALKNLDRWSVDEILILDISRNSKINDNVLNQIEMAKVTTPVIYGGGIRNSYDVQKLLNVGCDRIVIENIAINNSEQINEIANKVGVQAIIGSLPIREINGQFKYWDANQNKILEDLLELYDKLPISEILIVDADNEGNYGNFSKNKFEFIKNYYQNKTPKGLIWFGGIDDVISTQLLEYENTVSVAVGNINFEKEVKIPFIRKEIVNKNSKIIRKTQIL
jgi:cyclase